MGVYVGDKRYAPYVGSTRRKVMTEKALPYDAEIEYLESSGTQYIDTGVKHHNGQRYTIDIIATPTKKEADFLGTRIGDGGVVVGFYDYFIFGYNRPNTRIDTGQLVIEETEFHIEYDFKAGNRTLTVNGVSYSGTGDTYSATINTIRIYAGYDSRYNASMKCKQIVFKDVDNNLLIDMIPVRVGTTGYMYDKVSGTLFGNAGTGDFILGNDKN